MYQRLIRPVLFLLSAEKAHNVASYFLKIFAFPFIRPLIRVVYGSKSPEEFEVMGLKYWERLGRRIFVVN